MSVLLLLFFMLPCITFTMEKPPLSPQSISQSDDLDARALIAEFMQNTWNPSTTEKFRALDSHNNSAQAKALKDILIPDSVAVSFCLASQDAQVTEEEMNKTFKDLDCHANSLKVVKVLPNSLHVFRSTNSARSISLNYDGSTCAFADTSNKVHVLKNKEKNPVTFLFGSSSIKTIKVLEHDNLLRVIMNDKLTLFDTSDIKNTKETEWTFSKKIYCAQNGNWMLAKNHSNVIGLFNCTTGNGFVLPIRYPTCFAVDENNRNVLIGTTSGLYSSEIGQLVGKLKECIENTEIECVDITPDGKFGVAANHLGLLRIQLKETFPCIHKDDTTITTARIFNCGQLLLTGHTNGSVVINKVNNSNTIDTLATFTCLQFNKQITCLSLSGDNKTIAAGSKYGVFVASCKQQYDELDHLSPSKLVALLHVFNSNQLKVPQEIKGKFTELKNSTKLKVLKAKTINAEEFQCSICAERMIEKPTPCNHEFCNACLDKWKQQQNTCPICRALLS